MDDPFTAVIYPAKIVCQTCEENGSPGSSTNIINRDQGERWLRGHGTTFHNGPFEIGIWSGIGKPGIDYDALKNGMRDVWL